jgi:hypothetical protein
MPLTVGIETGHPLWFGVAASARRQAA